MLNSSTFELYISVEAADQEIQFCKVNITNQFLSEINRLRDVVITNNFAFATIEGDDTVVWYPQSISSALHIHSADTAIAKDGFWFECCSVNGDNIESIKIDFDMLNNRTYPTSDKSMYVGISKETVERILNNKS